jgi:hypothetical protein
MISAQTPLAFVARENRQTLFLIMLSWSDSNIRIASQQAPLRILELKDH